LNPGPCCAYVATDRVAVAVTVFGVTRRFLVRSEDVSNFLSLHRMLAVMKVNDARKHYEFFIYAADKLGQYFVNGLVANYVPFLGGILSSVVIGYLVRMLVLRLARDAAALDKTDDRLDVIELTDTCPDFCGTVLDEELGSVAICECCIRKKLGDEGFSRYIRGLPRDSSTEDIEEHPGPGSGRFDLQFFYELLFDNEYENPKPVSYHGCVQNSLQYKSGLSSPKIVYRSSPLVGGYSKHDEIVCYTEEAAVFDKLAYKPVVAGVDGVLPVHVIPVDLGLTALGIADNSLSLCTDFCSAIVSLELDLFSKLKELKQRIVHFSVTVTSAYVVYRAVKLILLLSGRNSEANISLNFIQKVLGRFAYVYGLNNSYADMYRVHLINVAIANFSEYIMLELFDEFLMAGTNLEGNIMIVVDRVKIGNEFFVIEEFLTNEDYYDRRYADACKKDRLYNKCCMLGFGAILFTKVYFAHIFLKMLLSGRNLEANVVTSHKISDVELKELLTVEYRKGFNDGKRVGYSQCFWKWFKRCSWLVVPLLTPWIVYARGDNVTRALFSVFLMSGINLEGNVDCLICGAVNGLLEVHDYLAFDHESANSVSLCTRCISDEFDFFDYECNNEVLLSGIRLYHLPDCMTCSNHNAKHKYCMVEDCLEKYCREHLRTYRDVHGHDKDEQCSKHWCCSLLSSPSLEPCSPSDFWSTRAAVDDDSAIDSAEEDECDPWCEMFCEACDVDLKPFDECEHYGWCDVEQKHMLFVRRLPCGCI